MSEFYEAKCPNCGAHLKCDGSYDGDFVYTPTGIMLVAPKYTCEHCKSTFNYRQKFEIIPHSGAVIMGGVHTQGGAFTGRDSVTIVHATYGDNAKNCLTGANLQQVIK